MSLRDALAGGLLLVGVMLAVQGAITTPTATVHECSGTAVQDPEPPTPTPTCVTYTERAWGQQLYVLGLGLGVAALGAGVVFVDSRYGR